MLDVSNKVSFDTSYIRTCEDITSQIFFVTHDSKESINNVKSETTKILDLVDKTEDFIREKTYFQPNKDIPKGITEKIKNNFKQITTKNLELYDIFDSLVKKLDEIDSLQGLINDDLVEYFTLEIPSGEEDFEFID